MNTEHRGAEASVIRSMIRQAEILVEESTSIGFYEAATLFAAGALSLTEAGGGGEAPEYRGTEGPVPGGMIRRAEALAREAVSMGFYEAATIFATAALSLTEPGGGREALISDYLQNTF